MTDDFPQGQSAYHRLLGDIRAGALPPGTRLRETELAERFGISRTPVREAIRQLETDGLVIHQPRQGATIRRLDHAEIIELYEMRTVLEGTAARLAARMALPVEIAELRDINDALAGEQAGAAAQELNRQFHTALLGAARNRFLVKTINALQKTLLILGPTTLAEPMRAETAAAEHAAVIDALQARDGLAAETAMRAHIESALAVRIRAMRGQPTPLDDD
ncbi:GntR family transcriptional regulator [Paracoccus sp. (in: a-proteobacteria)]|uniref:GntR family transcriptional regulator n=1 Tax=Paracoccus sp. TaxID=267 RepID=UPI0026DF72E2|nr:GntR family transcriptional regulator [Paracoccus sp. (in: a-proteobacteria)]MDO5648300.1 GntR family transcriptional regulator [Paracoccus sp. (in: a-proteobacteria)]